MGRALRDSVDPVSLNFWRWLIALAPFALPGLAAKRRDPRECRLPAVPRRHGRDALPTPGSAQHQALSNRNRPGPTAAKHSSPPMIETFLKKCAFWLKA